ncbi:MAG: hypothetical protein AAFR55_05825, partial [Pseudomonadota bacterium]
GQSRSPPERADLHGIGWRWSPLLSVSAADLVRQTFWRATKVAALLPKMQNAKQRQRRAKSVSGHWLDDRDARNHVGFSGGPAPW